MKVSFSRENIYSPSECLEGGKGRSEIELVKLKKTEEQSVAKVPV